MARSIRSTNLENRTSRLKLAARRKPYTARVAPGVRLGYRRNDTAGTWSVLAADGKGGGWMKLFAQADDYQDANGETVLDFWQAQERARTIARGDEDKPATDAPKTVRQALDDYEDDLKDRGGDAGNASRVRSLLSADVLDKPVALVEAGDMLKFKKSLKKTHSPASINRIGSALRAALNLAADSNVKRITNRAEWQVGLKALPGAGAARNVVLKPEDVAKIVALAYAEGQEFGLFVEVLAVTGARPVQIRRLEVQDLQRDPARLLMPSSKKGRGEKKIVRRPVPITEGLALRLAAAAKGQPSDAPLLRRAGGERWGKSDYIRPFRAVAKAAVLEPTKATAYALRHTSIVRQLLKHVPTRVVAAGHDTSVAMIEKNYSAYISDHADDLVRNALVDPSPGAVANVVPLAPAARK
jgi:integrase